MKVLDMFDDSNSRWDRNLSERDAEKSDSEIKKSENPVASDNDSGAQDQYFDPELQRAISYAQSHYPSYKDPQIAFDKWVQRSISHSEERDLEHDEEIENLYRKLDQVATDLNKLKQQGVAEGIVDDMPADSMVGTMDKIRGDAKSQRYHYLQKLLKQSKNPKTIAQIKALLTKELKQGVAEGTEQVFKVVAVTKSNALEKPTTLNVKASSLDEVFERLAINDWYPLEINGIEVVNGKRLKQGVAEGYKEPTDAAGHAKMAAKIMKMLDDTLADRGDRHGNPDPERLTRAYEYHMERAKEKSQDVAEGLLDRSKKKTQQPEDPSYQKGWELCNKDPSADPQFLFRKFGGGLDRNQFMKGFNDNAKSRGMKLRGDVGSNELTHGDIKYKEFKRDRGMMEDSGPQVGDEVYYGNRLVGWFKGYSKLGKIITEPNVDEMGDEYLSKDAYWDPQDKITIKSKQGVAEGQLNELDIFAPRTVYFKMADGNYIKADYRGSEGLTGGNKANDNVSFTSMSWVPPNVTRSLGLDKFLAKGSDPNLGTLNQNARNIVGTSSAGEGPFGNRTIDVVDFVNSKEDTVPSALKTKVMQWVQKNQLKSQAQTQGVAEGKFTINARTGAKLHPRTGAELPPKEKPMTMKQMFAQPKQPKLTLDDVWLKIQSVVSNIYPDGDPIDHLAPWLKKHGIRDFNIGEILDRAAKKNGYKDLYDYWESMGDLLLSEQGVAEGSEQISIQVRKGRSKFATELSVDGKPAGAYQYDADSGRSIAEVYPEYKGKGFGKILVLHAIYTAAKLGMNFVEDESRTAEYDNVLDSLDSNGLAVNDDGYWYVTGEGEHFLKQRLKQGVAEAKDLSAKISALEKKINVKQGALEMAREKRKMSGKSKGVQSEREVKLGAEISKLRQELHILKNSQKDLVEDKDSFGYPSYTIEQLQRMFRNGTWEPMSDLKPNSHVQIRNTTTGGRKTVHVKPDNQVGLKTTAEGTISNSNFLWSKLDPGLTVEEKIIIAEEIALRGNLKESVDEDKKEYFNVLSTMTDIPTKGEKYIVIPLMLVGDRVMTLDKPTYLTFVGSARDQLIFRSSTGERRYPSNTLRDLSIANTFTFLTTEKYDKFRAALALKFSVGLPDVKLIGDSKFNSQDSKQFEAKTAKVEAWGYMYNNRDQRIVWRKVFPSGEAAYRWADLRNATVLGTRETEDSKTEPRKPLFKESTVSIKRTSTMSTSGERSQQYQLIDALGRNIAVFEDAQQAKHIYSTLQKLREALEVSNTNPTDRVTMDIPLLLRVLEFAKEDAKTDMDLHDVTENLIDLSKTGQPLSMKDYEDVVDIPNRQPAAGDEQINEVGGRYWCKKERRWKDRS